MVVTVAMVGGAQNNSLAHEAESPVVNPINSPAFTRPTPGLFRLGESVCDPREIVSINLDRWDVWVMLRYGPRYQIHSESLLAATNAFRLAVSEWERLRK